MDRQAASKALAKAIAYVDCGRPEVAAEWIEDLLAMFEREGVTPSMVCKRNGWLGPSVSDARPEPVEYDLSDFSRRLGSQLLG